MDAANYLKRHGWRGDGHSLDHTGRGIRKPLLVSKKVDVLGVGVNKHAAVSDQWWMRAFDQGLKDLGTGKRSALADVREKGMAYGGLYGRFVKGEGVAGTFEETSEGENSRKRKREHAQNIAEKREKKAKTDIGLLQKEFARDIRRFVNEAVQRGLISDDADAPAVKKGASSTASAKYGEKAVAKVFKEAGLQDKKEPHEKDKYSRGKLERTVKRAARDYLLSQMLPEERKAIDSDDRKDKRKEKSQGSSSESDEKDIKKAKAKAEKALKKQAKRERNQAERNEIDSNADEIKIATTSKKKSMSIPGVGPVERYPTKAEKKAKNLQSQKENYTPTPPTEDKEDDSSSGSNDIGFTVDTQGDEGVKGSNSSADSMSVVDSDGNVRYTCKGNQPVPLDPTIWIGIKPKLLPKPVREARAEYMSQKREARQARKAKKAGS